MISRTISGFPSPVPPARHLVSLHIMTTGARGRARTTTWALMRRAQLRAGTKTTLRLRPSEASARLGSARPRLAGNPILHLQSLADDLSNHGVARLPQRRLLLKRRTRSWSQRPGPEKPNRRQGPRQSQGADHPRSPHRTQSHRKGLRLARSSEEDRKKRPR